MSTAPLSRRSTSDAPATRRGPRLRGLVWLVWRQNRTAFWIGLAVAAAVALYTSIEHQHITAAVARQHLEACRGAHPAATCSAKIVDFAKVYQYPMRRPLQAMLLVPLVLGMFVGSPQVAQELESGTYRTVCTQSVTRLRWFAAKLAVPVAMTVVISGILSAAMTWWWHPAAEVMGDQFPWYTWYPFNGIGPVVIGRSVLLLLIGVTCGLLLRRTVMAMGATLVVGAGALYLLERVRGSLLPMTTVNAQHTTAAPDPQGFWRVTDGSLSPSGAHVSDVPGCFSATGDYEKCMFAHGRTGHWIQGHPASQLWPLQWAETGLCLLLAAALTGLCVWWVRRRMT